MGPHDRPSATEDQYVTYRGRRMLRVMGASDEPDPGKGDPDPGKADPSKGDPRDPDAELLKGADNPDAVKRALDAERAAAKAAKQEADELRRKVKEHEDAQKTEEQRKDEEAAEAKREAAEANAKLLRFEVAAAKGIPAKHAHRLVGNTKDELEADADELKKSLGEEGQTADFGSGARGKGTAELSMDDRIRAAAGRQPSRS